MEVHDPFLEGLLWCPGSRVAWSSDLPMFKLLQPRWSLLFHTSRVYPPTIIPNECWSNPRISQWFIPNSSGKIQTLLMTSALNMSSIVSPFLGDNSEKLSLVMSGVTKQRMTRPSIIFRWKTHGVCCASELLEQCEAFVDFGRCGGLAWGELKASLMVPQVVSYVGTTRVLAMLAKTIWPTRVCRCIELDLLGCQHVINQLRGDWWLVIIGYVWKWGIPPIIAI